jgi:hypothetical protein
MEKQTKMLFNTLNISKPRKVVAKLILFLLIGLIAVGMDSCKKKPPTPPDCYDPANPDCVNYDPCYGKEMPTADFLIEDLACDAYLDCVFITEDSIFFGNDIRFRSTFENEKKYKHTWYIGTEILNDYQVVRDFLNVPRPAFITVSHVIRYEPDTICFPGDDGMDSVSRTFYLIRYFNELNIFGRYRGVLNNEIDSFDMEIYFLNKNGGPAEIAKDVGNTFQRFINFHNIKDTVDGYYFVWPVNYFGYFSGDRNTSPLGEVTIDPGTNQVLMNYEFKGDKHIFKGRKIN